MTATDPATAQPATPGQALRWAADLWRRVAFGVNEWDTESALRRWADELDAAPAAPGCTCTRAAEAIRTRLAEAWPHLDEDPVFLDQVAHHAAAAVCLDPGPLSTVPPAGTEGDR